MLRLLLAFLSKVYYFFYKKLHILSILIIIEVISFQQFSYAAQVNLTATLKQVTCSYEIDNAGASVDLGSFFYFQKNTGYAILPENAASQQLTKVSFKFSPQCGEIVVSNVVDQIKFIGEYPQGSDISCTYCDFYQDNEFSESKDNPASLALVAVDTDKNKYYFPIQVYYKSTMDRGELSDNVVTYCQRDGSIQSIDYIFDEVIFVNGRKPTTSYIMTKGYAFLDFIRANKDMGIYCTSGLGNANRNIGPSESGKISSVTTEFVFLVPTFIPTSFWNTPPKIGETLQFNGSIMITSTYL